LADVPVLANVFVDAYASNEVTYFLAPKAHIYRDDNLRENRQAIRGRILHPRNLSLVACLASDPSTPIGAAQFIRLGDDAGAREYVRERGLRMRVWIFVLTWFFYFYNMAENTIWPDRIKDQEARKLFNSWMAEDNQKYWKSHPERANRWQAQQVVVSPFFQGKGIGKKLVLPVMQMAQKEKVIMGLTASPEGELLYRKLGFEMLGDFTHRIPRDGQEGGGIMIWYPEGMDPKR
jgi:GNAT superfamily N-acetyltransferase